MHLSRHHLSLIAFLLLLSTFTPACRSQPHSIEKSFYYWKNTFALTEPEQQFLERNEISRLYIKYIDINYNSVKKAYPQSITRFTDTHVPKSIQEVVPVVYIVNQTMSELSPQDLEDLADNILSKINAIPFDVPITEIQIDCDWTTSTRDTYFQFLEILKQKTDKPLSATIRLHQYKYRKETGVPPVSRGMLMLYNLTDVRAFSPKNSIFEAEEAKRYLDGQQTYPLALDLVLPAYGWGVGYHNTTFVSLLRGITLEDARNMTFLEPNEPFFTVVEDTVYQNIFFRKGDHIKIEAISPETLRQAATIGKQTLNSDAVHVSFFHLDETTLKPYSDALFQDIFSLLR